MTLVKTGMAFMRSRTLTLWLTGLFFVYYLSMAVWSKEAFASYINLLASNNLFRAFYLLFFFNVALRAVDALRAAWSARTRFFLRLPLYLGLVLFLLSFFMSLNVRKALWLPPMGEGDVIEVPWERQTYRIASVEPALRKKALRTDDAAIFDYEPGARLMDGDGNQYAVRAFPPRLVGPTFMHVLNFGLGPGIEVRKGDEVVSRGYVALRLTPFGAVDTFDLQPLPYKFYVSIVPNRVIRKGKEIARDYDLEKPRYRVEIAKGDRIIARQETDTKLSFDNDMSLQFFTPSDWVFIEAVYDPFLVWFAAGLALLAAGAVLYPFSFLTSRP